MSSTNNREIILNNVISTLEILRQVDGRTEKDDIEYIFSCGQKFQMDLFENVFKGLPSSEAVNKIIELYNIYINDKTYKEANKFLSFYSYLLERWDL